MIQQNSFDTNLATTNNTTLFENSDFGKVRVIIKDGEPWFVAKDVAESLEYSEASMSQTSNLLKAVPDEWKGLNPIKTPGGIQEMATLSEQGLYFFVARSDKPKALPFQKWLAGEVLPTIRKTGSFSLTRPLPQTYAEALRALANEVEAKELAEKQRDEAIRTKAWIGNKREATAMATASVATRKVYELENRLGEGRKYKQVKAISWLSNYFTPCKAMYIAIGKNLSKRSKRLNYDTIKVPTPEYPQGIQAYHIDVIADFQKEVQCNKHFMEAYRII